MDKLNFINPVPAAKDKELRRWQLITILCVGGVSCAILILAALQATVYYGFLKQCGQRQTETCNSSQCAQQRSEKQQILQRKKQQYEKLNRYGTDPKTAGLLLSHISAIVKPISLQSCSITRNSFELTCITPSAQAAQQNVQKLAQLSNVKNVALTALNKEHNSFKATIRGTIIKKKSRA